VACDDEVNRVLPGYNYGWRTNYPNCDDFSAGGPDPTFNTLLPLIAWPYSAVPTGVMFYRGALFPEWKNDLFVCLWKDGSLHHFRLNGARTAIASHTIVDGVACNLDIENGPDGSLYLIQDDLQNTDKEWRDIYRLTRDPTIYASSFEPSTATPGAGEALTYTLRLAHYSQVASTFTVTSNLPPSTTLDADGLQARAGSIVGSSTGITWTGSVSPNTTLTATYRLTVSALIAPRALLTNTMRVSTDRAGSAQRLAVVIVDGLNVYLPVVLRNFAP